MVKGACCVATSILLFLPLAFWLYSHGKVAEAERTAVAQHFVMPEYCNPQPGERLAYLAGIVFLPAMLFALAFACRRWEKRLPPLADLRWVLGTLLAAALAVVAWLALLGDDYFHLRRNVFFAYPLLALPLLPAALAVMRWDLGGRRLVRPLLHVLAFGLAGLVFLACVFDDRGQYAGGFHFNAVFFPVVQVHLGKALLIDCASQYGLYPHLLQPLFAVAGLSVLKFSVVMALLTAGSFVALWLFLARATKNRTVAFLGFAALLFNGWSSFVHCTNLDLYYQYFPIRFVFPALLVWLGWRYLRRPDRRLYWGLMALLSVGALWNLDSGLPALLSWAATLCFGELFAGDWRALLRRVPGHLAAAAGALAAAVLVYTVVIRLVYGAFPDYGRFLYYQQLYFGAGYYKYPLNVPGTWLLAALVYLAGFAYAAFAVTAGRLRDSAHRGPPRAQLVFLLSVLGVGLSSYFQGLSNPVILLLVWWPGLLLLTIFLDEILSRLRERPADPAAWTAAAALGWVVVGSACSLVPELGFVGTAVAANLKGMADHTVRPQRAEEAEILRRLVAHGDDVLVASAHGAVIHLASRRATAYPSSVFQMVRMEEFQDLDRVLAESPSTLVLMDKSVLGLAGWQARSRGLRQLVGLLQDRYEATAVTEHSVLFARRPEPEGLLGPGGDALFQVGVRDDALGDGLSFSPLALHAPWSLEAVIRPAADQVPHAALVGNHPGRGIGGFVLHMDAPNSCALVAGDGKEWRVVLRFDVRPAAWNYVAVVNDGQAVTAYLDGRPVASGAATCLTVEDSPLPLQVGNWCGGDRPFHGLIREVRILGRAIMPQEVAERAERVQLRLPEKSP